LRTSALLATSLAGSALLAACGGSAPAATTATTAPASSVASAALSSSATSSSAASSAATTTTASAAGSLTAASSAAAPAGQKVTLEHLDWWGPTTPVLTNYFNGIKKDFEAKNPTVTINYTFISAGTTAVGQKWITNAAGGTPHDTSQVSVAFIHDLMVKGLMEPLDAYIARTPDMALSNFVDSGLFYNTYQGKHYGIPYDGPATNVIGYNTDHFAEVGLDPSRNVTWHWTFNDFVAAAQKLTKTQGNQVVRGGFQPTGWSSFSSFLPWLYANGGQLYDANYTHLLLDDAHGQGALQFVLDLKNKYNLTASAKDASLDNEGYSMILDGSWTAGYHLDANAKLHWGYAPVPQGPNGQHPSSQTWTNQWAINGGSNHKDIAWQWLSFVNAEDTLERYFAGVMKRAAGRKAFYQSAAWKAVLKDYPQLDGIETVADISGQYPWWDYNALSDATKTIWSDLGAGKADVTTALGQLKQVGDQVLAKG
jgi:multiple sugar transport system substrate-binding protein